MKNLILFLLICVTINAQTVYVNSSTGDDGIGNGSLGSPYKTFNKGYSMVNNGGTIDVTGTFTWTDAAENGDAATSGYTIAKNITIQGHVSQTVFQAASSSGSANCRVFTVNGAYSVTFNNLEIRYGNPPYPGDGGGMNFENSPTITISNCYIHHNISRQGVGIYISPATVSITNSTIANNIGTNAQSGVNGGGIAVQGNSPLTVTNTTICNNYIYGYGGGINTLASNTTTITNCTIVSNTSESEGGGISMGGPAGCAIQIKNSIVANNTSNTASGSADFDSFQGTLTSNGYNIVEVGTGAFTATGDQTGNKANLFGTGVSATPSLALNNSTNGTPTIKTTSGSVAINAGSGSANGSVSIPSTDQRGATRNGTTDIGAYEYWSDDGVLPVELTSFTASISNTNVVTLNWQTATEVNNYGFNVEALNSPLGGKEGGWKTLGFVQGHGNSNSPKEYSFTDKPNGGNKFKYRLKQIDIDGQYEYSPEVEVKLEVPSGFSVKQNFPNPFNPTTKIEFSIPTDNNVVIKVFNVLGMEVATLLNEHRQAGIHSVEFDASKLSSGIYFYKIVCGSNSEIKKMILLR